MHFKKCIHQRGLAMENEEKFKQITNSVKDAIILIDEESKVAYWNPASEKTFGYTSKEAINKNIHELVVPTSMCQEGKERIEQSMKIFNETGMGYFTVGNVELIGRHKNGSEFPVELSISPIKLSGKWNAVGVVKDLSERKKSDLKTKEAEQRYHALFNQSPLGVLIVDPKTTGFIEFNDVAHQQLGYSREEFEKLTLLDIEAKESEDEVKSHIAKMLKDGREEFETEHQTKDCSIKNILVSTRAIEVKNKKLLHCIFHDITEIRITQKSLLESETQYRNLVELAQEGVWVFNSDYVTTFVNPRMAQMLGYVQSEMLGKRVFEFLAENVVEQAEDFLGKNESGLNGTFEYEITRKDGSRIFASIVASQINDDQGIYCGTLALVADVTLRKEMEKKLEKYSKNLEEIVQQKTRQLAEAQAQIIKSERLTAIGELAGMIGHDLRNPLAGIKNASYYLKKKETQGLSTQSKEMLEIIDRCVGHSNKIINDLLDYSREIRLELKQTSIDSLLTQALELVQIPKKVTVVKQVTDISKLKADPDKLERVFINLVKNAVDAMPEGGSISIIGKEENNHLELSFTDTGMGIPDEALPKLFSPLSTTKAQGMGFGLAICKRIVEAHGGTISFKTAKGKGTTFTVTLPIEPTQKLEVKMIEQ
jgi:PAS domain S-box-containing protein